MSGAAREPVRWGILGTASIVRSQFLPGLREAGGGQALLVGSRDRERAEQFARHEGVTRAVEGYDAVIGSGEIDALYIALPNSLHGAWAITALEAGVAVLCEKPLTHHVQATNEVLAAARAHPGAPLWDAFAFPFHAQYARLRQLLDAGAIGELREIDSHFHFRLGRASDIRLSRALGGGALLDVGCYPVRLAQDLLGPAHGGSCVQARLGDEVEVEAAGLVQYPSGRLLFSCGFERPYDTFTRIIGSEGELRLSNPYHPTPADTVELRRPGEAAKLERPTHDAHSFAALIRHVQAVVREREKPRQLAVGAAAATATTLATMQEELGAQRRPCDVTSSGAKGR